MISSLPDSEMHRVSISAYHWIDRRLVHIDWKWYGTEDFATGDATTVRVPNLDLQEIIAFAASLDQDLWLGIWLWPN